MTQEQGARHSGTQAGHRRWSKGRAVLAGGLVLGVGAAVTLAAWTDQEWATGLFSSGEFGIEGSTDGTTFAEHPTSPGATLNFALDADKLSPNDAVYAGFSTQLTAGSDYAASVAITQDTSTAIANTTASYVYTDSATCDATTYAAGSNENDASFDLAAATTPQHLCFKVTTDSDLVQGQTGSITWKFAATSTDAL